MSLSDIALTAVVMLALCAFPGIFLHGLLRGRVLRFPPRSELQAAAEGLGLSPPSSWTIARQEQPIRFWLTLSFWGLLAAAELTVLALEAWRGIGG